MGFDDLIKIFENSFDNLSKIVETSFDNWIQMLENSSDNLSKIFLTIREIISDSVLKMWKMEA
jgi:hypothetical protein